MRRVLFCIPAIAAAVAACSSSSSTTTPNVGPVTFYKDVLPILQQHCQGCHVEGGIAPFSLVTYENAKNYSTLIVAQTQQRLMPPWGAQETKDCTPRFKWQHDPRLTQHEIDVLTGWRDQKMPAGNPSDAPPMPAPVSEDLPNKEIELHPKTPFAITDTSKDTFQCVVLDPNITEDKWINGVGFLPGNKLIAHHAVLFIDPDRESLKKMGPDGTYPCFGGAGLQTTQLLGAWAPGVPARDYPAQVGLPVKPGTLVVAQMHYHPSTDMQANKRGDDFKLQLRYTKAPPEYNLTFALIGNFANQSIAGGTGLFRDDTDPNALSQFMIPANSSGKTVTMRLVVPPMLNGQPLPKLQLLGVGAHMHWVGTSATIKVQRASVSPDQPENECLLSVPHWDFNWQRGYGYDVPFDKLPTIGPFDKLDMKCTYENTLSNQKVVKALKDQGLEQPKDVSLGETTLDEMCLGAYEIISKR